MFVFEPLLILLLLRLRLNHRRHHHQEGWFGLGNWRYQFRKVFQALALVPLRGRAVKTVREEEEGKKLLGLTGSSNFSHTRMDLSCEPVTTKFPCRLKANAQISP